MRIILFILLSFIYSCQGISQSFDGAWSGDLKAGNQTIPLIFSLQQDGEWQGTVRSPSQTRLDFKLDHIDIAKDSIALRSSSLGIAYAGRLSPDGKYVEGTFRQGKFTGPLRLARYDSTRTAKRLQQPMAPLPYESRLVTFENKSDAVRLAGTITQPAAPGKYPAVILVSGSGPQNRNSEVYGHKPFEVLADHLTRQGIVVLRYDDRGVAQSKGNFVKSNIADFSRDALAALSYLKSQDKVDSSRVGMIGHSEGGLIAFLLAGQHAPDLKFAVALAGPAMPIDSLMVLQAYHVGRSEGMDKKALAAARKVNERNFQIVKSDVPAPQAMQQLVANIRTVAGGASANPAFQEELQVMLLDSYRYFLRIDPVPFIRRIEIPVYAVFGGKDIQVPTTENQASLTANLPGNPQSRIKTYPNLNHLMQPAKTGALKEYYEIETTIEPTLLEDLSDWILGVAPRG